MKKGFLTLFLTLLTLVFTTAHAGALDALKKFLADTRSFQAEFSQSVQGPNSRAAQVSKGKMAIQKPGKFRWEITQPYVQFIVGDGKKIWLHDPELEQVTLKDMDQALGATPAALLMGTGDDVLRQFDLMESGKAESLDWVEARPKKGADTSFEKIRLGFDAAGKLEKMELFDNFGQTTRLQFFKQQQNPRLASALFVFTPPPGADVIGE
ncbi:outer-membrane lipoprotein carrier protein [Betaproteobacteria bacterium]|nr:outer-membrane lipoprotein carrier protein [Betaproteobacteria bacterium]GHU15805.1 outer-membrane lipoprotein carrier protein [Betaproteobacteria bacterium]